MKVAGTATVHAAPEQVWAALNDPSVLVRTIPGCQRLETIGPDAYAMTVQAGVASMKGVYDGEVRLTDQQPPSALVLKATGTGAPGTVGADVRVSLEPDGDAATRISYDADAVIGGMIGGVGQRMLAGVAKKNAAEFFTAIEGVLTGPVEEAVANAERVGVDSTPETTASGVYEAPAAARGKQQAGPVDFRNGALVGAFAALLGAVVGAWIAGRRTR